MDTQLTENYQQAIKSIVFHSTKADDTGHGY